MILIFFFLIKGSHMSALFVELKPLSIRRTELDGQRQSVQGGWGQKTEYLIRLEKPGLIPGYSSISRPHSVNRHLL